MTAVMAKPKKSSKKPAAKKPTTKKSAVKVPAKKPVKKPAVKKAVKKPVAKAIKKPAATKPGPRADYGKPIDAFLTKQPPNLKKIVDTLHDLVMEAAPTAHASLKWGQAFFAVGGEMLVAIAAHKAHVNLILPGPPGTYADPDGLLVGEGSTGKHVKLTSVDQIPTGHVRRWLSTAAKRVGA